MTMALRNPHPEYEPRSEGETRPEGDWDNEPAGAAHTRPTFKVLKGPENADLVPDRPLNAVRGIVVGIGLSVVLVWLPLAALLYRWLRG
jgi:hypothetical protein